MNKQELIGLLGRESCTSVSGITVECAQWPGYDIAFRMISKNTTGPWESSVTLAIQAYLNQKEYDKSVK